MLIFFEASVSICVGPRRSPAALCVGPPRSLCWFPALSRSLRQAPLSVSGPASLCRGPALPASPSACCVGPRRSRARPALSVSGPPLSPSLCRRSLCRGPAVLCRRFLCRAPPLSASALSRRSQYLFRGPALSVWLCRAAWRHSCVGPALSRATSPPTSGPTSHPCDPSGPRAPSSDPRATHPVLRAPVPPIQPGAFPFSGEKPKPSVCGNTMNQHKAGQMDRANPVTD